ncbi:MAG: FAD-binding oxidoreductase [Cyanobacteria bacterium P01_G01_bin.49]
MLETCLSGWGRYPIVKSSICRPEKIASIATTIQKSKSTSVLARGSGRSYGDAALNPQGITMLAERLNRMLSFDRETGVLCCEAGVTIAEILEVFVPRGWFPPVTPGTKFVTVGGAVASDVHGKNHHVDGSFANHVRFIKLTLASGETVKCSASENSDLFWATVGGMGLTGIITEVSFALQRIETAYINSRNIKANSLAETFALFEEFEPQYQYSVAWIDCLASGNGLGRSILMLGNHARINELNSQPEPLKLKPKPKLKVPFDFPAALLNRHTMGIFNNLYYGKQRSRDIKAIADYDSFFYPLDSIQDWNRLYGKKGFIQYQCVFPTDVSQEALTKVLQMCSQQGWGSFLAVLKRFGSQSGWLSFPMPGYTLTLDMPVKSGLWQFLNLLDEVVISYGGRVYLAKDARLSADSFRQMYPKFPQWLEVKSQVDPDNRFSSALSQRLQMESVREGALV